METPDQLAVQCQVAVQGNVAKVALSSLPSLCLPSSLPPQPAPRPPRPNRLVPCSVECGVVSRG
eukprot:411853-Rhodomonas_salina.1